MIVIGISGPSGSGKSTLCDHLMRRLPDCRLIQQDWYFTDPGSCALDANFCEPQYLHHEEFVEDVKRLISGRTTFSPVVDFKTFLRFRQKREITPGAYLLVEGMTIFRLPALYPCFDYRFYLAPELPLIRQRKTQRDLAERGKPLEVVRSQLVWVEAEYRKDLACLPQGVTLLRNCDDAAATAVHVLDRIAPSARLLDQILDRPCAERSLR